MRTCRCGLLIPQPRSGAGYTTCIRCGDEDAQKEIQAKQTRTGAIYNKGGYQYLGDPEVAQRTLLEAGNRKHIPIGSSERKESKAEGKSQLRSDADADADLKVLKRAIGVYYKGSHTRHVIYEGETPPKQATRVIYFLVRTQKYP